MKVKHMKSILSSTKYDNSECNFKLKSKGPKAPEWFSEFINNEFKPLVNKVDSINQKVDKLDARIDNLVTKNNLKE